MPSAAVESAFQTHLAANWSTVNGEIIGGNSSGEPPDDGSAFLLIQYPVVSGSRPYLTRRRFEEGVARIVYNVPVKTPLATSLALADAIADAFRGDRLKVSGVEMFEPSAPIITDDLEDGAYYELGISVPYRYQFDAT